MEAFELAKQIEAEDPGNEFLESLWPRMSHDFEVTSDPPGATVYYTTYQDDTNSWKEIGTTPFSARLPFETFRLKYELEGYTTREVARVSEPHQIEVLGYAVGIELRPTSDPHPSMLVVKIS